MITSEDLIAALPHMLAGADDLEKIKAALIDEYAIRHAMAETGEDRQTILDMIGALESMDQEAVLELTSGAPTTLADGLQAYIETLEQVQPGDNDEIMEPTAAVIGSLHALLTYPWPEEEATIATHGANASVALRVDCDAHQAVVSVGGVEVSRVDRDDNTLPAVEEAAEAVHRAVLSRVIGDREHIVQLNSNERMSLIQFLDWPNGSWTGDERLAVKAVAGGGVLIQTRPYTYVTPPQARR